MPRLDVSLTMDPEILAELDRRKEQSGLSRSEVANRLLEEAIQHRYERNREIVEAASSATAGIIGIVGVFLLALHLLPLV